ncbi:HTH-type transcriptional regulator MhqR [Maliponia aquimaris]|uniref:HTH-type transcriptional regulator MhqR n=2 Tax=Maliponia aquimaris TaxID=1673631 RepID=A0A238L5R1_9RHOB|nr:HTH-type transcriptional regulator MhqR [Maliponia aquimaris]
MLSCELTMDRVDAALIALRRILRATDLYGRELKQAAGVTAVQLRVLQIIAEKGQATPKEISVRMRVSQATMTSLVDKLVRDGMVVREKSEQDRRQTNVHITPKGLRTLAEAPDPLQQRFVRKFETMEDWEQAMLMASLERVAAMLDADDLDVAPVLEAGDIKQTPAP